MLEWECIKRAEAVALLKELGSEELIHPAFVLVERRFPDICLLYPDNYQLRIKGDYSLLEIGIFLKKRFLIEENKDYLIISSL
jgi:hypothetical protein